jgi:two-component system, OmpR family, alkaline phosphatase synthesis response regulator PhoP
MKPKILLVEDEESLAEVIADNLIAEGYETLLAKDGRVGMNMWQTQKPDLVVLDVMLPYLDGYELCKRMRESGDTTPVLFLSAKGRPDERVMGLQAGGDDYLPKPFHLPEFLLRVQNMLRRKSWSEKPLDATYSFGGHTIDFRAWTVKTKEGVVEPLGERELGILKLLVGHPNEVVSRDDILDNVWGNDVFPSSRTVDNFVMRLRKILEPDPANPVYIHTIWGVGYKFTPDTNNIGK